ncbi:hypothetical protein ACA910_000498 [Epithemia clementina (nom. ined.)]
MKFQRGMTCLETLVVLLPTRATAFRSSSTLLAPRIHRNSIETIHHPHFGQLPFTMSSSALWSSRRRDYSTADSVAAVTTQVLESGEQEEVKGRRRGRPYHLVIVESPSKCKTIQGILQDYGKQHNLAHDFVVTSCMGHIRDLPKKKASVVVAAKRRGRKRKVVSSDQEGQSSKSTRSSAFPYTIPGIDLDNQYQPTYEILPEKKSVVAQLVSLATRAQQVWLATDPDREGEAMAWHLTQVLALDGDDDNNNHNEKNDPNNRFFRRMRFTEITPQAIVDALQMAYDDVEGGEDGHEKSTTKNSFASRINPSLVQAQETRRILDRLCGFTMNPILWKKISPGLSAGRVQSVALALAVQRERERLLFESTAYSGLNVVLTQQPRGKNVKKTRNGKSTITAYLHSLNGTPVASSGEDFTSQGQRLTDKSSHKRHLNSTEARELALFLAHPDTEWTVTEIKSTRRQRSPPIPYRTSTLQQDANRKLGLSIYNCMRTAQQLYEQGLISYMRTDSSILSQTAEAAVQKTVTNLFGSDNYQKNKNPQQPQSGRKRTKEASSSKFAQEAHEAIRPAIQTTTLFASPNDERIQSLPYPAQKLYELVFQRVLASRMNPLITNQTVVQIEARRQQTIGDNKNDESTTTIVAQFRASGSIVIHPGYTLAYGIKNHQEDENDNEDDNAGDSDLGKTLPPLEQGESLDLVEVEAVDHETQPPARYTEASIVKELEALGVGRPSTYTRIVQVLRERCYVGNPPKNAEPAPPPSPFRGRTAKSAAASGAGAKSAYRAAGGDSFSGGRQGGASGPLVPSLPAFVVCSFLEQHCPSYVDPEFTAKMEERLDQIASSDSAIASERTRYLDEFYGGDHGLAATIKRMEDTVDAKIARRAILPALDASARRNQTRGDSDDDNDHDVGLFVGPWGPYVEKLGIHDEDYQNNGSKAGENGVGPRYTAPLPPSMCADLSTITPESLRAVLSSKLAGGSVLGSHPDDGRPILLKTGRYGAYLQWGEDGEEGTTTHSLPREKSTIFTTGITENSEDGLGNDNSGGGDDQLTFEEAVGYVGLPRVVTHIDDEPVVASLGPYGPYLKVGKTYVSLKKADGDVLTVNEEKALSLIAKHKHKPPKDSTKRGVMKDLGQHNGANILVRKGLHGPYLSWKKVNAKLPSNIDPAEMSVEEAWELLEPEIDVPKAKAPTRALRTLRTKKGEKGQLSPSSSSLLPGPPTKPLSAYMYFCAEKRPEVMKEATDKSLGAVSKELARMWRETVEDDRQEYVQKANQDKAEYAERKSAWEDKCQSILALDKAKGKESNGSKPKVKRQISKKLSPKTRKPKGRNSEALKVKRPLSAYMHFCQTKRPEVSERLTSLGEISKELGRLWSDTDDKTEYKAMARADKERYEKEKEARVGTVEVN